MWSSRKGGFTDECSRSFYEAGKYLRNRDSWDGDVVVVTTEHANANPGMFLKKLYQYRHFVHVVVAWDVDIS